MRIGVTGGRDFGDWNLVANTVHALPCGVLVHGNAPGADYLCAKWWTRMMGREDEPHPADWERDCDERCTHPPRRGRCPAAGPIRNQEMVDSGLDLLVAFPGGRGTADMVRRAKAAGIPIMYADSPRAAAEGWGEA